MTRFFISIAILILAQVSWAQNNTSADPSTTSLKVIEDAKNANQKAIDNTLKATEGAGDVAEQNAGAAAIDPNLVGVDSDETYLYDPNGKRDPFVPFKPVVISDVPVIQQASGPLEPLQLYDLSELQVVGIIIGGSRPRAMVMTMNKDKKVYPVVLLQKIGKNNGYVELIREGEIVVVEDGVEEGKITKVVRTMAIKK